MELATGPLSSRMPSTAPTGLRADPWAEFLQRVLPSTAAPAGQVFAAGRPAGDAPSPSAAPAGRRADLAPE